MATVTPGAEIFPTPELTPTAIYRGSVLVQLTQNPAPVEIKIGNCTGQYLPCGCHHVPVSSAVPGPNIMAGYLGTFHYHVPQARA